MNITVYLASSPGNSPLYAEAIKELGKWIGDSGHRLVFGGSNTGLMGLLADSVMEAGGEVIGVEYEKFADWGLSHKGLSQLIITKSMSLRRRQMIDLGDGFVAFPGGIGTLEEISEIIVKDSLGELNKPYVFYNLNGYYDALKGMFDIMVKEGFLTEAKRARIHFAVNINEIEEYLKFSK